MPNILRQLPRSPIFLGSVNQLQNTPGRTPSPGHRRWTIINTAAEIADVSLNVDERSWHLIVTNFGFDVPDAEDEFLPPGAAIRGIAVDLRTDARPGGQVICESLHLTRDAQTRGRANKGNAIDFLPDFPPKGGPEDLWREDWVPADIVSPNFGVILQWMNYQGPDPVYAELHSVSVTVWYR